MWVDSFGWSLQDYLIKSQLNLFVLVQDTTWNLIARVNQFLVPIKVSVAWITQRHCNLVHVRFQWFLVLRILVLLDNHLVLLDLHVPDLRDVCSLSVEFVFVELLLLHEFDAQLIVLLLILPRNDVIVVNPVHIVKNCNDAVISKLNMRFSFEGFLGVVHGKAAEVWDALELLLTRFVTKSNFTLAGVWPDGQHLASLF